MSEIAIPEKMNGTEQDRMRWNGMRNGINGMGLVLKIPLITTHEWQTGINGTAPNNHEQYIPIMIIHYHYYFIHKI